MAEEMARHAVVDLFPTCMPVARLSAILLRVKEGRRTVGDLTYELPRAIETADLSPDYLVHLCQALKKLISDVMTWEAGKIPALSDEAA